MPLRPYRPAKLPFKVGCDICYKPRIASLIRKGPKRDATLPVAEQKGNVIRFVRRVLAPQEVESFLSNWGNPESCLTEQHFSSFVDSLAGRSVCAFLCSTESWRVANWQ